MAITTEFGITSSLINSVQYYKGTVSGKGAGTLHCAGLTNNGLSATDSYPLAFAPATPGLAGATIDGTTNTLGGTIPFVNPASGNTYLIGWNAITMSGATSVTLFDFLWYNTGIAVTTTTAQTVNSITLPARDANGATSGVGVTAYLWISSTSGNLASISNTTISYTNAAGTAGLTGNLIQPVLATSTSGTLVPFTWTAGDTGVRSIQSITLGTSYVSGTINLIMCREIAMMTHPVFTSTSFTTGTSLDWAQLGFPRLYNGTALSIYAMPTQGVAGSFLGKLTFAQG